MPSSAVLRPTAACADRGALFQSPLLEEPPRSGAPMSERRERATLLARAGQVCARCPLVADCLYDAVAVHDVNGYVAGTTETQRRQVRRLLGIVVEPESLDTVAGVVGARRQVDHDEVIRLRAAHPEESLDRLAQRLGCSLSTVKRHLRRERHQPASSRPTSARPSRAAVLRATAHVLGGSERIAA